MSRMRTLLAAAVLAVLAAVAPGAALAGPLDPGEVVNTTDTWTWKG